MDMGGQEEGEGEMYGEGNIEIYNTICKIDSQWEFAVWLRELKQWLCDNLEGWDGKEMGGRGHGCTYGWFLLMYDRKPQNSIKQLPFKYKKNFKSKSKKKERKKEIPPRFVLTH